MSNEKDVEVVIKAPEELDSVVQRILQSVRDSSATIKDNFEGLISDEDASSLDNYATGLEKVAGLEAERNGLIRERHAAEAELARLNTVSPFNSPEPGAVDSEVARSFSDYDTRLTALQDFNTSVITTMIAAHETQSQIEDTYGNLSIQSAKKVRDFKIQYAGEAFGAAANFMENLFVATGSSSRSMFEVMKAAAISQTVIDTYASAQAAYKSLAGIPVVGPGLAVAAAASAIAAGLARVAQIRSTPFGGGTAVTAGGEAITTPFTGGSPQAFPIQEGVGNVSQTLTVNVYNPLSDDNWDKIVEDNIAPALEGLSERDVVLNIKVAGS
ncbi:MAG: hypothetical protein ACE5DW_00735 [Thermodesulfobacteriota bacterium]